MPSPTVNKNPSISACHRWHCLSESQALVETCASDELVTPPLLEVFKGLDRDRSSLTQLQQQHTIPAKRANRHRGQISRSYPTATESSMRGSCCGYWGRNTSAAGLPPQGVRTSPEHDQHPQTRTFPHHMSTFVDHSGHLESNVFTDRGFVFRVVWTDQANSSQPQDTTPKKQSTTRPLQLDIMVDTHSVGCPSFLIDVFKSKMFVILPANGSRREETPHA